MSGVARLRQSKKSHETKRVPNPKPGKSEGFDRQGDYMEVDADGTVGSGLAPKKNRGIFDPMHLYGKTPPPISDEMPSRGEYTKKRSNTSRTN